MGGILRSGIGETKEKNTMIGSREENLITVLSMVFSKRKIGSFIKKGAYF